MIRRRNRPGSYKQVKGSNTAATTIPENWLTTPGTATGRSPLQHFQGTWTAMRARGDVRPDLALVANRGLDPHHGAAPIVAGPAGLAAGGRRARSRNVGSGASSCPPDFGAVIAAAAISRPT